MAPDIKKSNELTSLVELFAPDHVVNPYPAYARLRKKAPVWQPSEQLFVLTRHKDAASLLRDARFGHADSEQLSVIRSLQREAHGPRTDITEMPIRSFLGLNPPDHTRLRGLVAKAFTQSRVDSLAPRIEEVTGELLDAIVYNEPINLMEALAGPLPVIVISELLGIPVEDRESVVGWSHAMARGLDPAFLLTTGVRERQLQAREEFSEYLHQLIAERRRAPGEDLISALVGVYDRGEVLSEDELVATCILLLVAGHETTTNLIGNGVLALLNHPDQLNRLAQEPDLIDRAVEELLRYDSPVQLTARLALQDGDVSGLPIPQGSLVLVLVGAANRDPEAHPDPDRLDIGREPSRHLAFGQGIHFCLGAPLARLEAKIAFRALTQKVDDLHLAGEPTWKENTVLRGMLSLPVIFRSRVR